MGLKFVGSKNYGVDRPKGCYLKPGEGEGDDNKVYFNTADTNKGTTTGGRNQLCFGTRATTTIRPTTTFIPTTTDIATTKDKPTTITTQL